MRIPLAFAVMFASFISLPAFAADDLFSEIALDSPFQKTASKDPDGKSNPGTIVRITGLATLSKSLRAAGFSPVKRDGRVLVETKQGEWKLPLYLSVAADQDQLRIELPVVTVDGDSSLDASGVLELLQANDSDKRLYFSYSKANGTIRLRHAISSRSVSPDQLKKTIEMMTNFAAEHADVWSQFKLASPKVVAKVSSPGTAAATTTKPKTLVKATSSTSSTPKTVSQPSLVGLWSASITNGEAFAIRIQGDNRFQLVHMKAGKANVSHGTASKVGNQLTLKGDENVTIVGTVAQQTSEAFQLNINGPDGKIALVMKFKRSKG